jgi:hypothetical protein
MPLGGLDDIADAAWAPRKGNLVRLGPGEAGCQLGQIKQRLARLASLFAFLVAAMSARSVRRCRSCPAGLAATNGQLSVLRRPHGERHLGVRPTATGRWPIRTPAGGRSC